MRQGGTRTRHRDGMGAIPCARSQSAVRNDGDARRGRSAKYLFARGRDEKRPPVLRRWPAAAGRLLRDVIPRRMPYGRIACVARGKNEQGKQRRGEKTADDD